MNELRQPRRLLPIISAITFLGFLDTHLIIPVMALYARELGASVGIIGLVIGLYSLTNTAANILFGRLSDKVGYKAPLIAGLIGDALSMYLYSVCRLPLHLALVRALHGATGGMVGPPTMSITADYSNASGKGRAMGFYGMSIGAATLVGYGLGGLTASRLGYEFLFWLGAIMLTIGAGLGLLLPGRKIASKAAEAPLGSVFERTRELLTRTGLRAAYISIFAQYFAFGGVVTLLPLYLRSLGMEAFHVGMLLAIFAIMFIILTLPSGSISDKVGRRMPVTIALSLSIFSLVLLPSLATFPRLALAMALYGSAYGILFPSISALIADHTIPKERGMATGIFHALLTTGVAIGAPIMGWVGARMGIGAGITLSPAILVLALIVAITTLRHS